MRIDDGIRVILSNTLSVPVESLDADTAIRSLPSADSLKMLNVILAVEKRYGIEIPDEATFHVETVGEFEELVGGLISAEDDTSKQEPQRRAG